MRWSLPAEVGSHPTDLAEPMVLVVHQDVTALKEAEQLKDHFLGLVAHELRTPLAALKGFVTMLLTQTARGRSVPLTDWQQEALLEIDLATDRLDRLTKDLLDVVRLQAGRLVLHPEPTDLVAL
jgi:signal transduction histidine kinase